MPKPNALPVLRGILATLYPTREDAYRIVEDAGLDPRFISFSDKAINNWHHILNEAVKHDKLLALVQLARSEFAHHQPLTQAALALEADEEFRGQESPSAPPDRIHHTTYINTGGGSYVAGDVNTSGGDFVGRDQTSQ